MKLIEKKGVIELPDRWTARQIETEKQTQGPVRKKRRLTDGLTDQLTQLSGRLTHKLMFNCSFLREPLFFHGDTVGCF